MEPFTGQNCGAKKGPLFLRTIKRLSTVEMETPVLEMADIIEASRIDTVPVLDRQLSIKLVLVIIE